MKVLNMLVLAIYREMYFLNWVLREEEEKVLPKMEAKKKNIKARKKKVYIEALTINSQENSKNPHKWCSTL